MNRIFRTDFGNFTIGPNFDKRKVTLYLGPLVVVLPLPRFIWRVFHRNVVPYSMMRGQDDYEEGTIMATGLPQPGIELKIDGGHSWVDGTYVWQGREEKP